MADAASRLSRHPIPPRDRPPSPAPGDLYVFGLPVAAAVEWLVVREHPDDPTLLLLTPADDFFLAGPADVALSGEVVGRPLTVRCGEAAWVPAALCEARLRVGAVPGPSVADVRRTLAALARGTQPASADGAETDSDPEYAAWMALIARARVALEGRAAPAPGDVGDVLPIARFTPAPPAAFTSAAPVALAASSGGPLLQALADEMAAGGPRYWQVPLGPDVDLFLAADATGVRVAWNGPPGVEPPALEAVGTAGRVAATWQDGPATGFRYAAPTFPWADGQVTISVGTPTPKTFTVRL